MNEQLVKAQDIIINNVNQICRKLGLNNAMAQLYVILYLSDKPLSLDDMLERLKISKGSVSVNIRALERYGAVRKVWIKGSRRDYYEAEMDVVKVVVKQIKSIINDRLSEVEVMISASDAIVDKITTSDPDAGYEVETFKLKLETLRSLQDKVKSIINIFNSSPVLENLLQP